MKEKCFKTTMQIIIAISVIFTILTVLNTIYIEKSWGTYNLMKAKGYNTFINKFDFKTDAKNINYEKLSNGSMQMLVVRSWDTINIAIMAVVLGISSMLTLKIFDMKKINPFLKAASYYIVNLSILILLIAVYIVSNANVLGMVIDPESLIFSYSIVFIVGMAILGFVGKIHRKEI